MGLGSRIAAFNRPLASAAVEGAITFRPGMFEYQDEESWLCWAATRDAGPFGPRNTIETRTCPPDIYCVFAAELMIWSIACMAKLNVMNSTIGLRPESAAPMPTP